MDLLDKLLSNKIVNTNGYTRSDTGTKVHSYLRTHPKDVYKRQMEAFVESLPSDLSYPQKTQKMWEKFAGVAFTGNTPNHIPVSYTHLSVNAVGAFENYLLVLGWIVGWWLENSSRKTV